MHQTSTKTASNVQLLKEERPSDSPRRIPFDREAYFKEQKDKVGKLIDGHIQQLAADLDAGRSSTLVTFLKTVSRFHRYSLNNQLLIALQNPDASHVAGFHAWKSFNRYVKKGEKGIFILAPITKVVGTLQAQDSDGTAKCTPVRKIVNSKPVHVFDIAQTDGEPLPEFAKVRGDPSEALSRLEGFYAEQGIKLEYVKRIAAGTLGLSLGKKVKVLASLDTATKFQTAVHETAHELLHKDERRKDTTKKIRETEAEAVAFVVGSAVSLDCSTASSDYVQLYGGNRETLESSLQAIRRAAKVILEAVLPMQRSVASGPAD